MIQAKVSQIFPGANIYSSKPSLLVQINTTQVITQNHNSQENVYARLIHHIKQLQPSHTKAWEQDLSALKNPANDVGVEETIAYLTILFQRWIGYPVSEYSLPTVQTELGDTGQLICIEYCQMNPASNALLTAVNLLSALEQQSNRIDKLQNLPFFQQFIARYISKSADQIKYIREAQKRNIPWHNLGETDEYIELGQGHKIQRVHQNFSMKTSFMATRTATNKYITNNILRSAGIPVPKQFIVTNEQQAIDAFNKLGHHVVVKPLATDFGTAVHPDLKSAQEVTEAFNDAKRYGNVLVESHIPGDHHRIMILLGKHTSSRKQLPAHVIGNGFDTVKHLVDSANQHRQKNGWALIPLDNESQMLLTRQQLSWESVPAQNQRVNLRLQGNLSTGGTMEIVTDNIHPENIYMAQRAAAIMHIDIAGIDFITTDISRPYYENNGQICEINVTPGFIFNEEKILFDEWFPNGENGRIPTLVFVDVDQNSHLHLCINELIEKYQGASFCLVNDQGVFLDKHRLCDNSLPFNKRIRLALSEPRVSAAAIFIDSKEVFAKGICLEKIDALFIAGVANTPENKQYTEKMQAISLLSKLSETQSQFASTKIAKTAQEFGLKIQTLESSSNEQGITNEDAAILHAISNYLNALSIF